MGICSEAELLPGKLGADGDSHVRKGVTPGDETAVTK